MSTEDYKRGVEDGTKSLTGSVAARRIQGYQFAGVPLIDMLNEALEDRRKSLLTKKVTKWTGVIKSNYSGNPCLLDLFDSEAEVNYYYTISPALCPPIKIEIEVPL